MLERFHQLTGILLLLSLAACADDAPAPTPVSGPRPMAGAPNAAVPEKNPEERVTAPILGKWRSSEENRLYPEDNGRRQEMELVFLPDGTYRTRRDNGYGVRDEFAGTYRLEDGTLFLTPEWRKAGFSWSVSVDEQQLVMTRDTRPGWKHILIRTDEPHPVLEALPPRPRTVDEAVAALRRQVSEEDQQKIRAAKDPELIGTELGMEMLIAGTCGLGRPGGELVAACGATDSREAAKVILREFWKSLREDE